MRGALGAGALLLTALGCSPEPGPVYDPSGGPLADFALPDVNPASSRYEQSVSPRDHLEQVSAWYFGHAT